MGRNSAKKTPRRTYTFFTQKFPLSGGFGGLFRSTGTLLGLLHTAAADTACAVVSPTTVCEEAAVPLYRMGYHTLHWLMLNAMAFLHYHNLLPYRTTSPWFAEKRHTCAQPPAGSPGHVTAARLPAVAATLPLCYSCRRCCRDRHLKQSLPARRRCAEFCCRHLPTHFRLSVPPLPQRLCPYLQRLTLPPAPEPFDTCAVPLHYCWADWPPMVPRLPPPYHFFLTHRKGTRQRGHLEPVATRQEKHHHCGAMSTATTWPHCFQLPGPSCSLGHWFPTLWLSLACLGSPPVCSWLPCLSPTERA